MTDEDTKCVGICPNEAIQFYVPLNDSVYFSSLPDGPLSGELLKGRCKNHFVHINDIKTDDYMVLIRNNLSTTCDFFTIC
jgi:hypothetical protein